MRIVEFAESKFSKLGHIMRRLLPGLALLLLWIGTPALAQSNDFESAPPTDSTSPTGVSYGTGAFTYELPVLSIGSGGFPQSLQLVYQYRSDGARSPNTAWTTNMSVRTSHSRTDTTLEVGCPPYCNPGDYTWTWNVVVGHRSGSFYKVGAGAGPGPYTAAQLDGASLTWTSDDTSNGHFTYTSGDGAQIVFDSIPLNSSSANTPAIWIEPDGTVVTYGSNVIYSNRGVALFTETVSSSVKRVCAVNLTVYYLGSLTSCPSGTPTITVNDGGNTVSSIYDVNGGATTFTYGTSSHLVCIKEPGQSVCKIENAYDTCDVDGSGVYLDDNANHSRDRVISQTLATGETITYSYISVKLHPTQTVSACRGNSKATMTVAGSAATNVDIASGTLPASVKDPLNRTSQLTWVGPAVDYPEFTRLGSYTAPEGNKIEYTYDGRGNVTETRRKSKSGSGLADIVTSATYPSSCSSIFTCNKPLTVTDANGNVTTYTYDASHGGVLTESGPAVGGVSPRKKYYYAQRYAWIKASGSGYQQAASPVWVLTEERSCRTSTLDLSAGTCSGGTSDLTKTEYDYGPNSGPNNLWLRGTAVTSNGVTLRTCYTYDSLGRKISETQPKGTSGSCP